MFLIKPLVRPILWIRRMRGDESRDPKRFEERFGTASVARPKGRVFWFHGASTGESSLVIPVVERILEKYPDATALITTMTLIGAENVARKLGKNKRVIHQFLPIDRGAYARKFLDHWKPSAGFFVGSDFWPNMLRAAAMRSIPLVLLNGQVSDRSFRRWQRAKGSARRIMSYFIYMFARSEADKKRLLEMGAKIVLSVGNLKYAAPAVGFDDAKEREMRDMIGKRPVWVAGDIHGVGFKKIEIADLIVKLSHKNALLIVVPHNPARGKEFENFLESKELKVALRSKGEKITSDTDVYIADTVGELGLFYKVADVAFVGGSLMPIYRGHNPFEAAHFGKPILSGPNVSSYREAYNLLEKEDAVIFVKDENELGNNVSRLLDDEELRNGYAERAHKIALREEGIINRIMDKVEPIIDAIG